ncbi:unnamed protein product [Mytilus coruscus]|uniref:FAM69 protein-kinase domain-containing protein n=1 Tax=Mytilus coruscus TaxID=42192 RepID=A0A6J8E452_MYTCO|nr:unnamed protein product [Mytilus coruscus]
MKNEKIHFTGWSKIRLFDIINIKNVHTARHLDNKEQIIIKKLAHNKEFENVDDKICKDANRPKGCDVARVLHIINTGDEIRRQSLLPKHLEKMNQMFACPTYSSIDRILSYYKERLSPGRSMLNTRDKLQIYATSLINAEPLMLQTFPAEEGWPFPKYYGVCGRYIAVSHAGEPLHNFFSEPFHKRADIAYQIMKIADKLKNEGNQFVFYWTDLSLENLVVDSAGKVTVVDLEDIIVVDRDAIARAKPRKDWYEVHQSSFVHCYRRNCFRFSRDDLCTHVNSDHNYYAACRIIISEYVNEQSLGLMRGLLHDMPNYANDDWDLQHLLHECVHGSTPESRMKVKTQLTQALFNLRNIRDSNDAAKRKR